MRRKQRKVSMTVVNQFFDNVPKRKRRKYGKWEYGFERFNFVARYVLPDGKVLSEFWYDYNHISGWDDYHWRRNGLYMEFFDKRGVMCDRVLMNQKIPSRVLRDYIRFN